MMPNTIDVSKTVELFATFVDNPVVVTTVGCIFLLYLLVLIWARRKDSQDDAKVSHSLNTYCGRAHRGVVVHRFHTWKVSDSPALSCLVKGTAGKMRKVRGTDPWRAPSNQWELPEYLEGVVNSINTSGTTDQKLPHLQQQIPVP